MIICTGSDQRLAVYRAEVGKDRLEIPIGQYRFDPFGTETLRPSGIMGTPLGT
ncbi:hypothetical protein D3C77_794840 [compost metagenome]